MCRLVVGAVPGNEAHPGRVRDAPVFRAGWKAKGEERCCAMPEIICKVSDGLRKSEATVMVEDFEGNPEFLPVDRDFLTAEGDNFFLPVQVIHVDERRKAALVG